MYQLPILVPIINLYTLYKPLTNNHLREDLLPQNCRRHFYKRHNPLVYSGLLRASTKSRIIPTLAQVPD